MGSFKRDAGLMLSLCGVELQTWYFFQFQREKIRNAEDGGGRQDSSEI